MQTEPSDCFYLQVFGIDNVGDENEKQTFIFNNILLKNGTHYFKDTVSDFMKNNKKNCKWVSGKDFNNFQYHYELEDESKEIIDERNTTLQEILHTAFMYIVTIPEKTDMNGIILNKGDEIDCIKIYVIDKSKKQRFIREGERPVADGKPTIAPRFKF